MPESTIALVKKLIVQLKQFKALCERFGPELQGTDLISSVDLCYSRLTFTLKRSQVLYLQYTVSQLERGGSAKPECYYHDPGQVEALKKHFEPLAAGLVTFSTNNDDPGGVTPVAGLDNYLAIAEAIASRAYLCASGDDYRPGYFSKMSIDAERISLEQINRCNSRSLEHKHNYTMRDLEFDLPLLKQPAEQKNFVSREEYHIGIMRIRFSDRSTQSNRMCGDQIRKKIEEEERRFIQNQHGS